MELFAPYIVVAELERALADAAGGAAPALLVELAWHLRQRDTLRARDLIAQAQAGGALPPGAVRARAALVQGEIAWLMSDLAEAGSAVEAALSEFTRLRDGLGQADAHWLRSLLAHARGQTAERLACLSAMAKATSDPVRRAIAHALQAQAAAFADPRAAQKRWVSVFEGDPAASQPAAACQVEFFLAACANLTGDYAGAIRHNIHTYDLALVCGQIRTAVFAAGNAGDAFNSLNEFQAALEWMERGLALARKSAWPVVLGAAMAQTAQTLRKLNRSEAARAMLQEALQLLSAQPLSRTTVITLGYLGDAELDCKHADAALETFRTMAARADKLGHPQLQSLAHRGQSLAWLQMARPDEALVAAHTAYTLAGEVPEPKIATLQVLADIYSAHRLSPPRDMKAPNPALHYLQRALGVAEAVRDFVVPPELFEALAQAADRAGLPGQAYRYARQAIAARKKTHSTEAANRACALQLFWQSTKERAEARNQQCLADLEARYARVMQQNRQLVQRLAALSPESVTDLAAAQAGDFDAALDASTLAED